MTDAGARGAETDVEALKHSDLHDRRPPRPPSLSSHARTRLSRVLILKATAEALFVLTLALLFYQHNISASFSGEVFPFDGRAVKGWVVNESDNAAQVEVQLFLDGKFAASSLAGHTPQVEGGATDSASRKHFTFEIRDVEEGEHEARVYAVKDGGEGKRTLKIVGEPLRFTAGAIR